MKQRPPSKLARADAHDVSACRADSSARSSAADAAAPAAAALPGAHRQSSLHTDLRSFQRRQMRAFACAPQPGRPLQAPLAHGRVAPTPAVRATTPRSAMDAPVRLFCATFLIWQLRRLLPDGSKNGLGVIILIIYKTPKRRYVYPGTVCRIRSLDFRRRASSSDTDAVPCAATTVYLY